MRNCLRCSAEMIEGLDLKTTANADKLRLVKPHTSGVMPKNFLEEVKAAVCPACGYLELYATELERRQQYRDETITK